MVSTDTLPRPDTQPAYERLHDEGAFYRRRVSVPREASFMHRVLAPIAEELEGRVYDDDGRTLIEWLERFWPYEIAGHGRSDGFRWSVIGATERSSVLVLITQSLLGERHECWLDVIVTPLQGTLTAAPSSVDGPDKVSVRTTREGVQFWAKGELAALDEDVVRALVRAGMAAMDMATLPGQAMPTRQGLTHVRSRPSARQWAVCAGFVVSAVLFVGLFLGEGLATTAICACVIVGIAAIWLFVPDNWRDLAGRSASYRVKRAAGQPSRRGDVPSRASGADRRIARLEEGRDIPDSLGDG